MRTRLPLLLLGSLLSAPALAAPLLICDSSTSRVVSYDPSANTPDYASNPSALLNPPSLAAVAGVQVSHWLCVGSVGAWTDVRAMTGPEQDALAAEQLAAAIATHKTSEKEEFNGDAGEAMRALVKVLLDEVNTLRASYPLPVTSITRSGTTGTITTRWAHGLTGTPQITVHGATLANYNGAVTATVTGASTFTYTVTGNPATPATGSITAFPISAAMSPRTLAQAKTAIQGAIDSGTVVE